MIDPIYYTKNHIPPFPSQTMEDFNLAENETNPGQVKHKYNHIAQNKALVVRFYKSNFGCCVPRLEVTGAEVQEKYP